MGHSDKFCPRLFDNPELELAKPYGVWMRAPFRHQVKPIGTKWLRNGEEETRWNMTDEGERRKSINRKGPYRRTGPKYGNE